MRKKIIYTLIFLGVSWKTYATLNENIDWKNEYKGVYGLIMNDSEDPFEERIKNLDTIVEKYKSLQLQSGSSNNEKALKDTLRDSSRQLISQTDPIKRKFSDLLEKTTGKEKDEHFSVLLERLKEVCGINHKVSLLTTLDSISQYSLKTTDLIKIRKLSTLYSTKIDDYWQKIRGLIAFINWDKKYMKNGEMPQESWLEIGGREFELHPIQRRTILYQKKKNGKRKRGPVEKPAPLKARKKNQNLQEDLQEQIKPPTTVDVQDQEDVREGDSLEFPWESSLLFLDEDMLNPKLGYVEENTTDEALTDNTQQVGTSNEDDEDSIKEVFSNEEMGGEESDEGNLFLNLDEYEDENSQFWRTDFLPQKSQSATVNTSQQDVKPLSVEELILLNSFLF